MLFSRIFLTYFFITCVNGEQAPGLATWGLKCTPASILLPEIPGVLVTSFKAQPVYNFSLKVPQNGAGPYRETPYSNLSFCNVTVTYSYTSPPSDFSIHTTVWLPLSRWNGRFQATGGSGFSAGLGALGLAPAVAEGYAAAETDSGHSETRQDPSEWALERSRHVNIRRLAAFASTSLNDLAILGKAITRSFYGTPPKYSYWNGCSTGGRQGLMLAQRYPDAFDGIAALSPAINWASLTVSTYWPQQVMNQLQHYPHQCELAHITQRALVACDADDGVEDGIISWPWLCDFDAKRTIGDFLECDGQNRTITSTTAAIVNAAWAGNGVWYGLNRGALLEGMANTTCTNMSDASCTGVPFSIAPWIPVFVEQNPNFDIANMTNKEYLDVLHKSIMLYQDIIGTANPDLSLFSAAGGKMITTHGLADPAVFPNGTSQYYNSVRDMDPHVEDYYRLFEAPGIGHCESSYTRSFYPSDTFEALVRWVEEGKAPETLTAISQSGDGAKRPLCRFPRVQHYVGGQTNDEASFRCV